MTGRRSVRLCLITAALLFAGLPVALAQPDALNGMDHVRVFAPPRPIRDAELRDQHNRPFRLSQLKGRVALVFFGFTHCPDVCPLAMQRFQQLHATGAFDAQEVAFVMIGVDAERDTPAAMAKFLSHFSEDFIGLSGIARQVKPVAKNFSAAYFKGGPTGEGDDYSVAHSSQVFVVDPAGQLRAELYEAPVETMTVVVRTLLDEQQSTTEPT